MRMSIVPGSYMRSYFTEGLPVIAMFFLGWSGGIELIQPYVNRYAEWGDFAANAAGLACGWLISLPMAGMRANAAADASK